ncbi:hypothetical protein ABZ897_27595 [Nonomuraea sp. NPDC046802]|uniref:hypothetical protein n=1 Tax=Nonomuraea sp. NPDC046802 TaxID=3154919 RepID=UPI0033F8E3A1
MSGVTNQSLAERFDTQYDRITDVGQNLLDKIKREIGTVRADMKAGFAKFDERLDKLETSMSEGFDEVERRFSAFEGRFDTFDANMQALSNAVIEINKGNQLRDLRIEKRDLRIDKIEHRLDGIESVLLRIEGKLPN